MYDKTPEEILSILETSLDGLGEEEAKYRFNKYGPNRIELEEEVVFYIFLRQFTSPLILVLIIASFIALYFGEIKDFTFIIVIVLINGFVGFYQEIKAKSKLKELLKLAVPKVELIRNGKYVELPADMITLGDVVILREGDIIPADVRLLETNNFLVDESILTGESVPVEKDAQLVLPTETPVYERKNIGFAGTAVSRGIAKGVVYGIGIDTEMGKIYTRLKDRERAAPLMRTIGRFSRRLILTIGLLLSIIFLIGLFQGRNLENLVLLIIAQLVSAVPEGLPIVITIALVVGAITLYRKNVLIRQLPAVEALGSATFICTDKTGTITENRLTVSQVFSLYPDMDHLVFALANDSDVERGDPIEIAMLKWLEERGFDYISLREEYKRVWLYPFDTKLKLMASINRVDGKDLIFVKGAFEILEKMAVNKEDVERLKEAYDNMAQSGLRVLAYGYGEVKDILDNVFNFKIKMTGLVGFLDPPKSTAFEAVKAAKEAGINMMMITGDSLKTAKVVAQMVGIYQEDKLALEGWEISKYSDDELRSIVKKISVIARATPEDKYRVVKILQESEEVVMIGDGVNDMPAVKSADLGIAMSEGSEATKSVAKMVLLERDLSVIVDAIRIGRRISHNLRKVILYLVSTSIGELMLLFSAFVLSLPQPLYATQILWVNLITDGIQDKPLAITKEERWIFSLKPRVFSNWFLDKFQLYRIFTFAIFMTVVNISLFSYLLKNNYPLDTAVTVVFTSVVFTQWAHGMQAIRDYPFFYKPVESFRMNPYLYLAVLFVGIPLQVAGVYLLSDFLHCEPLPISDWKYPLLVFFSVFIFLEIRKWFEFKLIRRIYS